MSHPARKKGLGVYIYIYIYVCVYMYIYMCVCVCVCVCVYVCVCVCVCEKTYYIYVLFNKRVAELIGSKMKLKFEKNFILIKS